MDVDGGTLAGAGLAGAEAITIGVLLVRRRRLQRRYKARRFTVVVSYGDRDDVEAVEHDEHAPTSDPVTPPD